MGVLGTAVLSAVLFAPLSADAQAPSPELLAKILFKIATYDGNLPHGDVRVAVVYPQGDTQRGPAVFRAVRQHDGMLVNGRRVVSVDAPYGRAQDLARLLGTEPVYALFVVASVPSHDLDAIRALAKARSLMTFAQNPEQVAAGLTAGVRQDDAKREILLNVHAASEQQRRFDGAFLGACTIVR